MKKIIKYFLNFEFIRFGIVGVLNTIVDFGLLTILVLITKINTGFAFIGLRSFTFLCGVLVSFPLNRIWTFKDTELEKKSKFIKFLVITFITLLINNIITGYLVVRNSFNLNQDLWAILTAFGGAIVALLIRYLIFKKYVFKKRSTIGF